MERKLYISILIFSFCCALVLLRETYGIDINKRTSRTIGIDEENEDNKENKLSDKSFLLFKNRSKMKTDVSQKKLISKKQASQISTVSNQSADLAIDGDENTCSQTGDAFCPWFKVQLDKVYHIIEIKIKNGNKAIGLINVFVTRGDYDNPFTIGKHLRCGEEIQGPIQPGQEFTVSCVGRMAQNIYIYISSVNDSLSFCEIEVYGEDPYYNPCKSHENECDPTNSKCKLKDENDIRGGYTCQCFAGYKKKSPRNDKECIDINECAIRRDVCGFNKKDCVNLVGGYKCVDKKI